MSKVYRKAALDKLSSPEQLDRMIVIVSPSFWLFLAGAALIIVTTLLWSIFGRLPLNVDTQGIYINEEGIRTIYSETSGIVKEVFFNDGDTVKEGDVIFISGRGNRRVLCNTKTTMKLLKDSEVVKETLKDLEWK